MAVTTSASQIVQRLWNYCNVLRDDGVSYSDYLEQLTYLLFLKMADEQNGKNGHAGSIPKGYDWQSLLALRGDELEAQYRHVLSKLAEGAGLIAIIFRKAQNKIQDPVKLRRLIDLIDNETWFGLGIDVKGTIYEGLLEKNAQDTKSGAGQYFTPRPLIQAIVDVMNPKPGQTICDPACGTGGFLLAAYEHIAQRYALLDQKQLTHLRHEALHGWEIVDNTARLCVMNLYLHGIGTNGGQSPIRVGDSLIADPKIRFDIVLTNPPFGKKSSISFVKNASEAKRENESVVRTDFWASTSNKQLNFLQHIKTVLNEENGKAAVIVPDNVLFEGGAGEMIRRNLLREFDVHTLLRLPTGIFYAHGVKANVLFFDRKSANNQSQTSNLWIYDLRTNQDFTLKQKPLTRSNLDEFVDCFQSADRSRRAATWSTTNLRGRWRSYTYNELLARDKASLDLFWLRDETLEDTTNLPALDVLVAEIIVDLRAALE
jgi:type I restriction enzyme M protein